MTFQCIALILISECVLIWIAGMLCATMKDVARIKAGIPTPQKKQP